MSSSIDLSAHWVPDGVLVNVQRSSGSSGAAELAACLVPLLSELSWRTHFFLVHDAREDVAGVLRPLLETLARFVTEHEFVTYYVHPLIPVGGEAGRAGGDDRRLLLDAVWPFRERAYELQTEARLVMSPIIQPAPGVPDASWVTAVEDCEKRLARPSVFLAGPLALARTAALPQGKVRFYVDPEEGSGTAGTIRQLWRNRLFEELLSRVEGEGAGSREDGGDALLAPCRPQLLIDQPSGRVFSCFDDWIHGRPLVAIGDAAGLPIALRAERLRVACGNCWSRTVCSMKENLIANDRVHEGGRAHLGLAIAFSAQKEYARAVEHASRAHELARSDAECAAALTCKGLCHFAVHDFAAAEAALQEAMRFSDDPGLVAYHRGRVQFEWRDYIEALDRFEEALASGSAAVPKGDLYYYMVASHVALGECAQARPYLERWKSIGERRAVMLYFSGLCDLEEKRMEAALSQFIAAEQADPEREDQGRILFYIGHCLKELERYEEAIVPLRRASDIDSQEIAVFNLLGFCYYKTHQHAEAARCFQRAVELDPDSAIDHANLAANLTELGRIEDAVAHYRRALTLDPSITFARENLRKLLTEPDPSSRT